MFELEITSNLNTSSVRYTTENGRKYLVATATILRPQILHGSKGPLLYPEEEIARNPGIWNGTPITNGHPKVEGSYVSVNHSGYKAPVLGFLRNDHYDKKTGKRRVDTWFDIETTNKVDPRIIQTIESRKPLGLSTGLMTDNFPNVRNDLYKGKQFTHIAKNYRPDHLAILVDQPGACSIQDGCGINVNQAVTGNRPFFQNLYTFLSAIPNDILNSITNDSHNHPVDNAIPSTEAKVSPEKACKILDDDSANRHKLTKKQKGMFGAICGRKQVRNEEGEEITFDFVDNEDEEDEDDEDCTCIIENEYCVNCGGKGGKPGPCPGSKRGSSSSTKTAKAQATKKAKVATDKQDKPDAESVSRDVARMHGGMKNSQVNAMMKKVSGLTKKQASDVLVSIDQIPIKGRDPKRQLVEYIADRHGANIRSGLVFRANHPESKRIAKLVDEPILDIDSLIPTKRKVVRNELGEEEEVEGFDLEEKDEEDKEEYECQVENDYCVNCGGKGGKPGPCPGSKRGDYTGQKDSPKTKGKAKPTKPATREERFKKQAEEKFKEVQKLGDGLKEYGGTPGNPRRGLNRLGKLDRAVAEAYIAKYEKAAKELDTLKDNYEYEKNRNKRRASQVDNIFSLAGNAMNKEDEEMEDENEEEVEECDPEEDEDCEEEETTDNALSMTEKASRIYEAFRKEYPAKYNVDNGMIEVERYPLDIYDDYLIYEERSYNPGNGNGYGTYRRDFEMNESGEVKFSGEAQKVRKVITYDPVTGNIENANPAQPRDPESGKWDKQIRVIFKKMILGGSQNLKEADRRGEWVPVDEATDRDNEAAKEHSPEAVVDTFNQGDDMLFSLTEQQRKVIKDDLAANQNTKVGTAWKGTNLDQLSDDALVAHHRHLKGNKVEEGQTNPDGSRISYNERTREFEYIPPPSNPTANCGGNTNNQVQMPSVTPGPNRPNSFAEALQMFGTPEEKAVWNTAIQTHNQQKQALLNQILANTSNAEAKQAAFEVYKDMSIPQLMAVVAALPKQQKQDMPALNFMGSSGFPMSAPVGADVKPLRSPVYNFRPSVPSSNNG